MEIPLTHTVLKLSTASACRVAQIDRVQFNEAIASGAFGCAPATTPGRTRYFEPDDMLALYLFRELMEDGLKKEVAGRIACSVAEAARQHPDSRAISYVETFVGSRKACPATEVPGHDEWDEVTFGGSDVRKVTTFRIGKMRELIARHTEEERRHIGEPD